jgi:hypothetical protein
MKNYNNYNIAYSYIYLKKDLFYATEQFSERKKSLFTAARG